MGNQVWFEAGILPAFFAVLAVFNALTAAGTPWRRRLHRFALDMRNCLVALLLLAALGGLLRGLGLPITPSDGCQPSPNGRICEGE